MSSEPRYSTSARIPSRRDNVLEFVSVVIYTLRQRSPSIYSNCTTSITALDGRQHQMETHRATGVTLDMLNNKPKPECRRIMQHLTKIIDELILTAHNTGGNHINYDLDTTYDIPTMQPRDASLYIYSELIET